MLVNDHDFHVFFRLCGMLPKPCDTLCIIVYVKYKHVSLFNVKLLICFCGGGAPRS